LGWDIVIHYHSETDDALQVQKEIISLGRECHVIYADFMTIEDPGEIVREAKNIFPKLDVLINNASIYEPASLTETTIPLFDRQFKVNFRAPFFLSTAFAKNHQGLIINILDNKIHFNQWEYGAYILSKKALSDLTVLSALEFAPKVRVNGIAPGIILPNKEQSKEYLEWHRLAIPLGTIGNPEQIMFTIKFIIGNTFLNGQVLTVDGGESIQITGHHSKNYYGQLSKDHHIVVLSVGSNIEPEKNISLAREILMTEQCFVGESQLYHTQPVGKQDQPNFHNLAFVIRTGLTKDRFKKYLIGIEQKVGRIKGSDKSGPCMIDLDIVIWDGEIVNSDFFHQEYISTPVNEVKHLWEHL
jgi:2-amino-4-hydroxy-6-hydroxymethyldihydropteridine diphosphokinase